MSRILDQGFSNESYAPGSIKEKSSNSEQTSSKDHLPPLLILSIILSCREVLDVLKVALSMIRGEGEAEQRVNMCPKIERS